MANDPGWYPDPWRPGRRRWWDGQTWTDHTHDPDAPPVAPPPAAPPPAWAPVTPWTPVDPATLASHDLAAEASSGVWAKRAFVALAAATTLANLLNAFVFGDYVDSVRQSFDGTTPSTPAASAWLQPLGLVNLASLILLMVWTARAGRLARNLSYPATRSVAWGVAGWIIPIINFWFPYQAVRDMLPWGHPQRASVGRWWACYLTSTIGGFVVMIASVFSLPLAVALVAPLAIAAALAARFGCELVDVVLDDHRAMVARITSAR